MSIEAIIQFAIDNGALDDPSLRQAIEQAQPFSWAGDPSVQEYSSTQPDPEQAQKQEPVAWIYEFYADMGHKGLAFEEQPSAYNTPLYTSPSQRQPLTDEQIYSITGVENRDEMMHRMARNIARAIEAAHGITGEST